MQPFIQNQDLTYINKCLDFDYVLDNRFKMSTTASTKQTETNLFAAPLFRKVNSLVTNKRRSFAFEIADRKSLLYLIDMLFILVAIGAYCTWLYPEIGAKELISDYYGWLLSGVVFWSFFSYVFDLYSLENIDNFYSTLKYLLVASSLTILAYLASPWFTPSLPDSKLAVFLFAFNVIAPLVVWRYTYFRLLDRPIFLKRVLVVGAGWSSKSLIDVFANGDAFNFHLGYKVVGIIDSDTKEVVYKGVRIVNGTNDFAKLVRRLKIDEIIVEETSETNNSAALRELTKCRMNGAAVTSLSDFYERLTGRVLINAAAQNFHLAFPYNRNNFRRAYLTFSRALDICFGLVGTLLCVVLIPFVYVSNFFGSRGPLFYKQERVGLYGKTFCITKFRSMVVDAEKNGAAWAQQNDSRITSVGRFLRRSRIDELPQAWSVLKGDMSLIGPRPERPVFVQQLKKEIPFYDTRHLAKPGITGWAQAIYKYGSNTQDALMKVQYDLYYLKNRSIMMDIKVLLKTISVVVRFKGM